MTRLLSSVYLRNDELLLYFSLLELDTKYLVEVDPIAVCKGLMLITVRVLWHAAFSRSSSMVILSYHCIGGGKYIQLNLQVN